MVPYAYTACIVLNFMFLNNNTLTANNQHAFQCFLLKYAVSKALCSAGKVLSLDAGIFCCILMATLVVRFFVRIQFKRW